MVNALLVDAFGRVKQSLHEILTDIPQAGVTWRPAQGANSIAWLAWHLTRVQDDHLTGLAHVLELSDEDQVWLTGGWSDRFALPFDIRAHGYGQSSAEVEQVTTPPELLLGYHDAVADRTVVILGLLQDAHLGQIVDDHWDPPVTAASRLVSIVNDTTQHVGQAAYIKGLWQLGLA